jgi:hypothetical protein
MYDEKQAQEVLVVLARSKLGIGLEAGTLVENCKMNSEDLINLIDDAYVAGVAQTDKTGVAKQPFLIDKVADKVIAKHFNGTVIAGTEIEITGGTLKEILLDAYQVGNMNSYSPKRALDSLKGELAGVLTNVAKLDTKKLKAETQVALQHLTEAYNLTASGLPEAHSLAVQHVEAAKNLLEDGFTAKGPAANHISYSITAMLAKEDSAYVCFRTLSDVDGKVSPLIGTKPTMNEVRDFVAQVVKGYSQVFDDPTAGGKLAEEGIPVPAIAVPKQKPTNTAEIEAVKQVQKAYEATMAVADLLEAGKDDEALKQYVIARKEATKAFHALEKCPEYRPEAREALGKALKPHERDIEPDGGRGSCIQR